MSSFLRDVPIRNKDDAVTKAGGRQPVGDEHGGLTRRHIAVLLVNIVFRNGVQRRRTMLITADTKEQLDSDTEALLAIARKHMCQLSTLKYQQFDGMKTVLPIGVRKINAFRTLTTESLAVFMPFKVQEIMDKGGIYYGENAISHNLIINQERGDAMINVIKLMSTEQQKTL